MTLPGLLAAAVRAVRVHARLIAALYLVQLGLGAIFIFIAWRTLPGGPLLARGVAGDDAALLQALPPGLPELRALFWTAAGLLLGYTVVSLYLGAGLLGAFAGRGFSDTASTRFLAFVRLWIWALVPYAAGAILVAFAVHHHGPILDDALALERTLGRLIVPAAPGLLVIALTCAAVDHARAELVLGCRSAVVALARGFAIVLARRPAAAAIYLLYLLALLALGALYLGVSAALAGPVVLFVTRQLFSSARFVARAAASAAQLKLQLDVIEVRQIAKRPEARGDVGVAETPKPVEPHVLDAE